MEINDVTEKIIGASYNVSNTLGTGFLEKVYENALIVELKEQGLFVEQQKPISVFYKNQNVGDYYADLVVENEVIVELKATKNIAEVHQAQILNYLKATGFHVGLLINFGSSKVEIKRFVNNYKK